MTEFDQDDKYEIPVLEEAVYEFTISRRKVGKPFLSRLNPKNLAEWLRAYWTNKNNDSMLVFAVSHDNNVLGFHTVLDGNGVSDHGDVKYSVIALIRPLIQLGVRRFIVAIHQSGNVEPDMSGILRFCAGVAEVTGPLDLDLIDVLVVAQDGYESARAYGQGQADEHGSPLHLLAHEIIADLGGDRTDHERLDERDPDDLAWAKEVILELAKDAPDEVLDDLTMKLIPIVIAMKQAEDEDERVPESRLPEGFLSLETLMGEPLIDTDEEEDNES